MFEFFGELFGKILLKVDGLINLYYSNKLDEFEKNLMRLRGRDLYVIMVDGKKYRGKVVTVKPDVCIMSVQTNGVDSSPLKEIVILKTKEIASLELKYNDEILEIIRLDKLGRGGI